ncbi:hypothetical protein MNBD_GAMMA25-1127 [hydrothermal vent metagenome]|uniref:MSHA biogenesis protein MshJ n=1 Tax=hydrothermal vent metagenome TaxID=652676 RepID=A0A3B1APH7_9ZZZZ
MNAAWLKTYLVRFDALAPREQIAVSSLLLVSLLMFLYLLVLEPQMLQAQAMHKQIENTTLQVRASEQQIALLEKRLSQNPNAENQQLLARLQMQMQQLNLKLQMKVEGLIAPAQMAEVLEAVLTQTSALKLEKLNNLPVRPLLEENSDENEVTVREVGVYQHGLQIEFRGSYLQMLAYLKLLKALPWNFYWDSIEVTMDEYPQAQIVISVHTLSFTPGWIGV